jgi:hypothetical protein
MPPHIVSIDSNSLMNPYRDFVMECKHSDTQTDLISVLGPQAARGFLVGVVSVMTRHPAASWQVPEPHTRD